MRALAGPAMLLVIVGGFALHRAFSSPDAPSRDFLDRELAAPDNDDDFAGTCFALSTVIIANTAFSPAQISWQPAGEDSWTLSLEDIVHDARGPVNVSPTTSRVMFLVCVMPFTMSYVATSWCSAQTWWRCTTKSSTR